MNRDLSARVPSTALRVLLTRPRPRSERLAARLRQAGHSCAIDPVFTIEAVSADRAYDKPQAIILTSANAVAAAANMFRGSEAPPVVAVGPATARAARRAGLRRVTVAAGTATSVAAAIIEGFRPERGPLLHVCGQETAGDLPGWLGSNGFEVLRRVVYRVVPLADLPPRTAMLLDRGRLDTVMLLSPRTAATFATLVAEAGLRDRLARVSAFCLSPNVAGAIGGGWHEVRTARYPAAEAMLALAADASPTA